jgi:type 1 glutamine amidotransferase
MCITFTPIKATMVKKLVIVFVVFQIFLVNFVEAKKKPAKILVFSKTLAYRHKSIKDGIAAIQRLGQQHRFAVDTTENVALFTPQNLKQYRAIIFLSPTGEFFNDEQKAAFQGYIRNGGGFVGIHAATDCLFEWEWYGKMVGAYFTDHPKVQPASLIVEDRAHLSTKHLPNPWKHTDEWYNFRNINPNIKLLLRVDEKSYTGGKNGEVHPMSWYHKFEGGRIFVTALGHTPECYTANDNFLQHLLGGIKYAAKIR